MEKCEGSSSHRNINSNQKSMKTPWKTLQHCEQLECWRKVGTLLTWALFPMPDWKSLAPVLTPGDDMLDDVGTQWRQKFMWMLAHAHNHTITQWQLWTTNEPIFWQTEQCKEAHFTCPIQGLPQTWTHTHAHTIYWQSFIDIGLCARNN